jgi:flagellar biogenesis protein FliO
VNGASRRVGKSASRKDTFDAALLFTTRRLASWPALVLLLLLFSATPLAAQTRAPTTGPVEAQAVQRTRPASGNTAPAGMDWQRLVLAMLVVLGLIVALRYLALWLFPTARIGGGGRGVRVVARTAIAPRQQVLLLHVGRRVLVVGDSAGTLSPLASIEEPDEVAELLGQVSTATTPTATGRFRQIFGRAETQYEPPLDEPTSATPVTDDGEEDDAAAARDPRVAAAHDDINGLLDRMRALTKTARR